MLDLTTDQMEVVVGGNPAVTAIAIVGFFVMGGYEASVDFTSGMIEGFMDAAK